MLVGAALATFVVAPAAAADAFGGRGAPRGVVWDAQAGISGLRGSYRWRAPGGDVQAGHGFLGPELELAIGWAVGRTFDLALDASVSAWWAAEPLRLGSATTVESAPTIAPMLRARWHPPVPGLTLGLLAGPRVVAISGSKEFDDAGGAAAPAPLPVLVGPRLVALLAYRLPVGLGVGTRLGASYLDDGTTSLAGFEWSVTFGISGF